ncbi:hypothetical protein HK096_001648, partial [Nowakowskiella sp. JEL0078]
MREISQKQNHAQNSDNNNNSDKSSSQSPNVLRSVTTRPQSGNNLAPTKKNVKMKPELSDALDTYTICEKVGSGSFGDIYKA